MLRSRYEAFSVRTVILTSTYACLISFIIYNSLHCYTPYLNIQNSNVNAVEGKCSKLVASRTCIDNHTYGFDERVPNK